jgi:Ni2+-binding GTPase involved in maturation of urease and hydrogenase
MELIFAETAGETVTPELRAQLAACLGTVTSGRNILLRSTVISDACDCWVGKYDPFIIILQAI